MSETPPTYGRANGQASGGPASGVTAPDRIFVSGLAVDTVIGLYDWERMVRQSLLLDIELACDLRRAGASDDVGDTVDYKSLTNRIRARVETSRFLLIETLACDVAELCLGDGRVAEATVTVHKRGALRHAQNVGVRVTRRRGETSLRPPHRAFVCVGSNIEPVDNVRRALRALHERFGAIRVSPAYRTRAVGCDDGADFLNLAVELWTDLGPTELWSWLRALEKDHGRVRSDDRNAPRTLDLDLALWDDVVRDDPSDPPVLPDALVDCAPFVLVPLADIAADVPHPVLGRAFGDLRATLPTTIDGVEPWDEDVLF